MENNPQSKWKREFGAGGVVFKKENGRVFILLIMAKGPNFGPPTGIWSYPKGHIDGDEKQEQAAMREVHEETGVMANIKLDLGSVQYFVNWGGKNILKFVKYFLMEYISGDLKPDQEISEVKWFELGEAEEVIKYETDKEIFEEVKKFWFKFLP